MGLGTDRPITVLHVIARMNVGGPAVEIVELMRGLDPNCISQRLVTGRCREDEADYLDTQASDVPVTRVEELGRRISPTNDAYALQRLIAIIRASRPDIVHTHTAKAGVVGRVAAKAAGTGARTVHTYHGHLLHGYFGAAKTQATIEGERLLARVTDRIIAVGDRVRDDLVAAGIGRPQQYTVVRSGVGLGSLPSRSSARSALGLAEGSVVVTMIGRLTRIKRPDRFAEVAEITRDRGLDVHFLVAGGGDEAPWLQQRVEERRLPVTLLGWRADIERLLAASDAVILTSDNEGTPLSLMQAAQAGIPAVACAVGSVDEVVEDGVTGLLTDPDAGSLASAVEVLARDPALRERLGSNARERSRATASLQAFLDGHEAVYAEVLGRRPRVGDRGES